LIFHVDQLLPTMLPLLVSSLDDYDPRVRMQACKALRSFLQITDAKIDGLYHSLRTVDSIPFHLYSFSTSQKCKSQTCIANC
jgi:hypothetical protein